MARIGIYSGSFNPIHSGHVSFALQATEAANLDVCYFLPERHRSGKSDMVHYGHRVAMIRQAVKPHRRLKLTETNDISHSVARTWPKLKGRFADDELVLVMGSDELARMAEWPHLDGLSGVELVVGVREGHSNDVGHWLNRLPLKLTAAVVIDSYAPGVSSSRIRQALRSRQPEAGILPSVKRYSDRNWLYISLA